MPKLSELPPAGALTGSEIVPIEQGGITCRTTTGVLGIGGGTGGGTGSDNFTFIQATPSASWSITHNLGRFPSVDVIDSSGRLVEGDITYLSSNALEVDFSAAFSGTAYCN